MFSVIYEPKETDNEERSAELFQQFSKEVRSFLKCYFNRSLVFGLLTNGYKKLTFDFGLYHSISTLDFQQCSLDSIADVDTGEFVVTRSGRWDLSTLRPHTCLSLCQQEIFDVKTSVEIN